jgi:hypothetical protein
MSPSDGEPAWQGKAYNASKDKKHLTGINKEGRGGKVGCMFHLLLCNSELISELMITEGNKQKRQSRIDPAFFLLKLQLDLLFKLFPQSQKSN